MPAPHLGSFWLAVFFWSSTVRAGRARRAPWRSARGGRDAPGGRPSIAPMAAALWGCGSESSPWPDRPCGHAKPSTHQTISNHLKHSQITSHLHNHHQTTEQFQNHLQTISAPARIARVTTQHHQGHYRSIAYHQRCHKIPDVGVTTQHRQSHRQTTSRVITSSPSLSGVHLETRTILVLVVSCWLRRTYSWSFWSNYWAGHWSQKCVMMALDGSSHK